VLRESTPYQRIVVTSQHGTVRLFLNGNLQFNSRDEYRYHEALVHPAMAAAGAPRRVLVLGGGDGMALREILRYRSVEQVTLVELDPAMTALFSRQPMLTALNGDALHSPKLRLVNADAFGWLEQHDEQFDVIVVDFPDPSNYALGKLYSTSFYELVDLHLAASGYAGAIGLEYHPLGASETTFGWLPDQEPRVTFRQRRRAKKAAGAVPTTMESVAS